MSGPSPEATRALTDHASGDPGAAARLLPLVYDRLRALARQYMQREDRAHTLQPTALVHEAYLRLVDVGRIGVQGKTHFFALAAREMRRVLVEHARAARAQKRGAGERAITLADDMALTRERSLDLLALDQALTKLSRESRRQCRVAELRIFSGMVFDEIARVVGVTDRTVKNDWKMARAWLSREIGSTSEGAS